MQEMYVQQLNALNGALLNSNRSMQLVLADDINRTQEMYAQWLKYLNGATLNPNTPMLLILARTLDRVREIDSDRLHALTDVR